jgi:hypothetical protein
VLRIGLQMSDLADRQAGLRALRSKASVLGPLHVGDGAFIGAHALVTGDVPAGGRVRPPAAVPA